MLAIKSKFNQNKNRQILGDIKPKQQYYIKSLNMKLNTKSILNSSFLLSDRYS